MILDYLKRKLARKKARRITNEYPSEINYFDLQQEGRIEFANWKNPLVSPKNITQHEVNFFKKFIPNGSFAIDIGGNIGDTTVPMGLAAGREGMVLGFDPNPFVYKILNTNASLNKDKTNIVALPYAITEIDGDFYYRSSEASFSNGGITKQPTNYHGSFSLKEKIKGINLENYLHAYYEKWLPKLSLIKIDAEGYDKEIIKSIHHLIEQYKPVIISECFSKSTRSERDDLFESVASKNYEVFYFEDFDENTKEMKITKEDMGKWKHFNFFALSQTSF